MSFTPTPSSIGPETHARPTSPPKPWPRAFPAFEYWVRVRASGVTGFAPVKIWFPRSEEHTSELQSQSNLVCRLLLEKKKTTGEQDESVCETGRGVCRPY